MFYNKCDQCGAETLTHIDERCHTFCSDKCAMLFDKVYCDAQTADNGEQAEDSED
jgi:endogenous inhibitor of DNA gyrase (YacG/DUF329 family)